MEHTKGEWEAKNLKVKVYGRGIIAQCPLPTNGGTIECVANVRLIAAAPDLLAACKSLLIDNLRGQCTCGNEGKSSKIHHKNCLVTITGRAAKAEQAIAKAEPKKKESEDCEMCKYRDPLCANGYCMRVRAKE